MLTDAPQSKVNFWTPTPWRVKLPSGSRWGFMLKAPVRRIGGFGTLVAYEEHTVAAAWEKFGPGNGVASAAELESRVIEFATKRSVVEIGSNPVIGCVVLDECVFLPAEHQVRPEDLGLSFQNAIVKFKTFPGELILPFEEQLPAGHRPFELVTGNAETWDVRRNKRRLAQPIFRSRVLAAYDGTCAMTGTACSEVLDAAHIQPFINLQSNHPQNGIALRKDVHALFDAGLITVAEDLTIVLSPHLPSGEYADLVGTSLALPSRTENRPSQAALTFHREHVFRS